jgi:hypothetical protein
MSKTRFLTTAIALMILIALVLPAPARELVPRDRFDRAAEAAAAEAGASYALLRCAGLYRSVRLHAGRAALGPDRWAHAERVETILTRAAVEQRTGHVEHAEHDSTTTARDAAEAGIDAIAALYVRRYAAMIAMTGRPWSADPMWKQDNATCNRLLAGL